MRDHAATMPSAPVLPDAAALAAIAERAWPLRPPQSHELRNVRRSGAGILIDGLLTRVARGHGALEVALGEALAALAEGDRVLRLGFSNIRDYARERLGIGGSAAERLVGLARELRDRPLLASAVRSGEITVRQAQTVLPVARGDEERAWVAPATAERRRRHREDPDPLARARERGNLRGAAAGGSGGGEDADVRARRASRPRAGADGAAPGRAHLGGPRTSTAYTAGSSG